MEPSPGRTPNWSFSAPAKVCEETRNEGWNGPMALRMVHVSDVVAVALGTGLRTEG
jgi:hypothetical protein